ncbi:MAG: SDR family NAD(P)-dependent oxidoreductase [Rhodospirillaceae bacterium]|nr:SDR family NAD(P)-dependent oxidoreductase [Rhodospirillaceae bacterium]
MAGPAHEAFAGGAAVITGAASGIGEGLAREAAALGMCVVLADIAGERLEKVAADITAAGGKALPVLTDVADPTALDRLADRAYAAFGSIRMLVNNAGIETVVYSWELPIERWEQTLNVNIHGVVHDVRAFAPRMLADAAPAYIANVASIGGLGVMPLQTSYILSKHAVIAFSECLYLEMQLQKKPVNVSVVVPGPVATRIFADATASEAGASAGSATAHRGIMRRMLSQSGLPPRDAARLILNGIAAQRFWVSTHPEITAHMAKARAEHLASLATPTLSDETRQLLAT